jgi:hypothetical protein
MGGISNECFAVAIGNDQVNTNYYPVIEDCIGTQPANIDGITNNGITMFSIHADGPSKSGLVRGGTIRGCMVYNIVSAAMTTGSPLFIHAFSDGTGGMTVNNFAYNLTGAGSYGIYNDTWDGRDSVIMGNVMDNVFRCVMFNMDSYHRTGVVLANNILRPAQNGIGVYYYRGAGTDTNSYAKWFGMQGNIIYPAEGAVDVTPVSIDTTNIPTLVANILQGQGTQPDFEFFQPSNTVANANFTNAIPP